jgi:hypothetical protein
MTFLHNLRCIGSAYACRSFTRLFSGAWVRPVGGKASVEHRTIKGGHRLRASVTPALNASSTELLMIYIPLA